MIPHRPLQPFSWIDRRSALAKELLRAIGWDDLKMQMRVCLTWIARHANFAHLVASHYDVTIVDTKCLQVSIDRNSSVWVFNRHSIAKLIDFWPYAYPA